MVNWMDQRYIGGIAYMKMLVLFFFIFFLSIALTIMIDLMMGMKISMAIRNMKGPFSVMTIPEYFIMFVFLAIVSVPPIASFLKSRKQVQPREKS